MTYNIKKNPRTKKWGFIVKGKYAGGSFKTKKDADDWIKGKTTLIELKEKGRYETLLTKPLMIREKTGKVEY